MHLQIHGFLYIRWQLGVQIFEYKVKSLRCSDTETTIQLFSMNANQC